MIIIIIVIIIIFFNCEWVDTRWQSFIILHMYGLFALDLVVGEGAKCEACSGNLECKTGTIPAFALGPRKTK